MSHHVQILIAMVHLQCERNDVSLIFITSIYFKFNFHEKECPELPDPDHGQVTLQGRHFKVYGKMTAIYFELFIIKPFLMMNN